MLCRIVVVLLLAQTIACSTTVLPEPTPAPKATYEEVLALPQSPDKLLVDVRMPEEIRNTGLIPTSINVPVSRIGETFSEHTTADQFRELYGRKKPDFDDEIIVSCRIGKRAEIAAQQLVRMGYTKVKNYHGSWMDWAKRNGLPQ